MGCRRVTNKQDLVRLVAIDSHVVIDEHQRQPGRGAYVHAASECIEQAVRRKAITRGLRVAAAIDQDFAQLVIAAGPETDQSGVVG